MDNAAASLAGAAFVYEYDGTQWTQQAKLLPSVPDSLMQFGSEIATSDGRVFVGAPMDSSMFINMGSVYVYENVNGQWQEVQRILPEGLNGGQQFGDRIAALGNRLFIGGPQYSQVASSAGAVYVYEHDGSSWVFQERLDPSVLTATGFFGTPAYDGETLAVGSPRFDGLGGSDSGAVYVLAEDDTGWVETQILQPSDSAGGAQFGGAVAVEGDWMAVGAGLDSSAAGFAGSVYLFQRVNGVWVEVEELLASDAEPGDSLAEGLGGTAVDLHGDVVVAGAYEQDEGAMDAGAAYTWSISGATCKTLVASTDRLSLAAGGVQLLRMSAGASAGGAFYWLAGTTSGTDPGFGFASLRVPLNPDGYFASTLVPNTPPLMQSVGVLDAAGRGAAQARVPPNSDPSLIGLRLDHAFVAFRLGPLLLDHVSNPARLTLDP